MVVHHKNLAHEVALAKAPGKMAVVSSSFVAAAAVVAIAVAVDFAVAELAAVVAH